MSKFNFYDVTSFYIEFVKRASLPSYIRGIARGIYIYMHNKYMYIQYYIIDVYMLYYTIHILYIYIYIYLCCSGSVLIK